MLAAWRYEQQFRHARCGTYEWQWQSGGELDGWIADRHWCGLCEKTDALLDAMRSEEQANFGMEPRFYPPPPAD